MMEQKTNRLFVVNKPLFISSNQYLGKIKKRYKNKKAGFSGTLDPFAKGCLIVAFGQYTKLFQFLKKTPKKYKATLFLGAYSETLDIEKISKVEQIEKFSLEQVTKVIESFKGKITQIPPKYSAKRINGIRAYDLARQGIDVDIKKIEVEIFNIKITNYSHPFLSFEAARNPKIPPTRPMISAPPTPAEPEAGVIATRPATAPEAPPMRVALLYTICSAINQPITPSAAATLVIRNALPATPSAATSEPALNPNQPNHSRVAPSTERTGEKGFMAAVPYPFLLPRSIATTKPATPALICTTVPPAKSISPKFNVSPPPHAQCVTGAYTAKIQSATKIVNVENFTLSIIEPDAIATAIAANVPWNATNKSSGIVPVSDLSVIPSSMIFPVPKKSPAPNAIL
jgi:tRNA pseudouridine(55) synthase